MYPLKKFVSQFSQATFDIELYVHVPLYMTAVELQCPNNSAALFCHLEYYFQNKALLAESN